MNKLQKWMPNHTGRKRHKKMTTFVKVLAVGTVFLVGYVAYAMSLPAREPFRELTSVIENEVDAVGASDYQGEHWNDAESDITSTETVNKSSSDNNDVIQVSHIKGMLQNLEAHWIKAENTIMERDDKVQTESRLTTLDIAHADIFDDINVVMDDIVFKSENKADVYSFYASDEQNITIEGQINIKDNSIYYQILSDEQTLIRDVEFQEIGGTCFVRIIRAKGVYQGATYIQIDAKGGVRCAMNPAENTNEIMRYFGEDSQIFVSSTQSNDALFSLKGQAME